VVVQVRTLPVPKAMPDASQNQTLALRETCQQWVNQLWADKDAQIHQFHDQNGL
jgi:hypothetical protein